MVQSNNLHYTSMAEAAQRGDLRAIAFWLNQVLVPYGMHTRIGSKRPGHLKLLVEFDFPYDPNNPPSAWREQLIRLLCHRIWKLNSPLIEGIHIVTRFTHSPSRLVWQQAVRIVTPANQRRRQHTKQLRSRIRQTSRRKSQLKAARTILVGGPAVAAVVVGGILGYTRAPVEQKDAAASSPKDKQALPTRPDSVRTALEVVPVVKHNQVPNPHDPTVTLMFSGDVTLSDHFEEVIGTNYNKVFAKMPEYQQVDLAMINLENPLTRATLAMPGKQFNFKAEPEAVEVLTSGGVDIVSVANNHTMDYKAEGLIETLETLDAAGIQYVGAGKDSIEARRPTIIDVKGKRIGYLSYWGEEYGAGIDKPGVNNIDEKNIAEDIQAIRDQVDWIVVNYHWGQELADFPADWQVTLAHFSIDQGADLVVGHHPHVLQGAEIYKGRPIAYSLGNFIFGGNSRTDYDTAVLKVALNENQMKVEFLPVEVKNYQPQVVQGDRAKQVLQHVTQLSSEFKQPMPASVILDAQKPPNKPAPSAPPVPRTPDSLENEVPASPVTPNSETFTSPETDFKQKTNELPGTTPSPYTPDAGVDPLTPSAPPSDQDLLPGYGGPATTTPAPQTDSIEPDAFFESEEFEPDWTDPSNSPTNNSISPAPTPSPSQSSPQLPPTFSQPGSFTDSPSNTPINFQPSPSQDLQGAVPQREAIPASSPQLPPPEMLQTPPQNFDSGYWPNSPDGSSANVMARRSSISFEIQPQNQPATDAEESLKVALAAPMMW